VFDSTLRIPVGARVVQTAGHVPTRVLTRPEAVGTDRAHALRAHGVEVVGLRTGPDGRPAPEAALAHWTRLGWSAVLLEGGAQLHGAFLDAGLVDYVCWFSAPKILGGAGARAAIQGRGAASPDAAVTLDRARTVRLGPDLLIEGWVRGRPTGGSG